MCRAFYRPARSAHASVVLPRLCRQPVAGTIRLCGARICIASRCVTASACGRSPKLTISSICTTFKLGKCFVSHSRALVICGPRSNSTEARLVTCLWRKVRTSDRLATELNGKAKGFGSGSLRARFTRMRFSLKKFRRSAPGASPLPPAGSVLKSRLCGNRCVSLHSFCASC